MMIVNVKPGADNTQTVADEQQTLKRLPAAHVRSPSGNIAIPHGKPEYARSTRCTRWGY